MFQRDLEWCYWLVTVGMLTVGLAGCPEALMGAIGIMGLQLVHMVVRMGSMVSFPVQVRAAYLIMLMLGLWPPLSFLHWVQFAGTWSMVFTNYCFLARCLSLLPTNRDKPLTTRVIARTFFSPPVKGSILK